jgi:hypothetical protein
MVQIKELHGCFVQCKVKVIPTCMYFLGNNYGEIYLRLHSLSLSVCLSEGFRNTHFAQGGYMITQFFDGSHLLIQLLSLNEVTQMRIHFVSGQFVQFQ